MTFNDCEALVTGGAGFIGANLAKELVQKGARVTIFDDFSSGSVQNIRDIEDRVTVVKADVRDFDSAKRVVKNQDFIFHLAANTSVSFSVSDPRHDFEVNALGTLYMLKSMLDLDSDAVFLLSSSAAVYGEAEALPISEDQPTRPMSPYGASKLAAEQLCRTFHKNYGLRTVCLRYFNVYGPLQRKYVMLDLLKKLDERQDVLEVLGTGDEMRDFIFVSDVVDATLLLAQLPAAVGETFNVGSGVGTRIRDVASNIVEMLGLHNKTRIHYTGTSWKGDVKFFWADIKKIMNQGFHPKVELRQGLELLREWYQGSLWSRKGDR